MRKAPSPPRQFTSTSLQMQHKVAGDADEGSNRGVSSGAVTNERALSCFYASVAFAHVRGR